MKKLELGPIKCHALHIRNKKEACPILKAHDINIERKKSTVYFGDSISDDASNNQTIEQRKSPGLGAINEIYSLADAESLGYFYFEVLITLRDSILISKLVFNAEVWYGVSKDNIKKLEEIDELFWRKAFQVCRTVPKESLYILSGKLPVKYIIMKRRLMYWFHLCHCKEDKLIFRVYQAQCTSVHKSDWAFQLRQDTKDLNIKINDNEVKLISKAKFKSYIENQIKSYASNNLNRQKDLHSKSRYLPFFNGKPDEYLLSKKLTKGEKINLYKLKTRMIDLAGNFPGKGHNKWCRLCCLFFETQEHLLNCVVIRNKLKDVVDFDLNYSDIEGSLTLQEKFAKTYTQILTTRDEILTEQSPNGDHSTVRGSPYFQAATNRKDSV